MISNELAISIAMDLFKIIAVIAIVVNVPAAIGWLRRHRIENK